VNCFDMVGY